MKLADLAAGLPSVQIAGDPDLEISRLACHTRDAAPGGLFFCCPALTRRRPRLRAAGDRRRRRRPRRRAPARPRGHRGCSALGRGRDGADGGGVPRLPDARADRLRVTGTNGKTTTAHLLASILAAAGLRPALLGTVVNRIAGVETPVTLTTAESLDLQAMFRRMVDGGDDSVRHGGELARPGARPHGGIDFDAVLFTNLTRDHLDFHRDVDDYFAAKRRLFLARRSPPAACRRLRQRRRRVRAPARRRVRRPTATISGRTRSALTAGPVRRRRDVRAHDLRLESDRSSFRLDCPRLDLSPGDRAAGCRRASTSTTRSPRRRRPWRPGSAPATWLAGSPAPPACRAASSRSAPDSRSPCSSTTPTRPTRWRTC